MDLERVERPSISSSAKYCFVDFITYIYMSVLMPLRCTFCPSMMLTLQAHVAIVDMLLLCLVLVRLPLKEVYVPPVLPLLTVESAE